MCDWTDVGLESVRGLCVSVPLVGNNGKEKLNKSKFTLGRKFNTDVKKCVRILKI